MGLTACHPFEVGKTSASLLVSCVGVVTCPRLCPMANETAEAGPMFCTEYGPNGWMELSMYKSIILPHCPPLFQQTVHRFTSFCVTQEKVFVWETSHTCTASVTCWSLAKGRPLKASLSVPKRWKSEVNRSPLYGGCSNTLKFSYQRVSMYGLQCVDAQCRATMQPLLIVDPSNSIK